MQAENYDDTVLRPREIQFFTTLPIDAISSDNMLAHPKALEAALRALKCIGIDGVVVEVWWGQVEGQQPRQYCWRAYFEIFHLLERVGLVAQVHMCFHGNEAVQLPAWVLKAGRGNPHIFFADQAHSHNTDCLSIGIDELPLLCGRTPLECYRDLMASFEATFRPLFGGNKVIRELIIGMGPEGHLCYPSMPASQWEFPGVGEFQCYDDYMLSALQAAAMEIGCAEYGLGGPHDAGSYRQWPHQTKFFSDSGSWASGYGQFFLEWYSQLLLQHADLLLDVAAGCFGGDTGSRLETKVKLPGIYWWHHTNSHAAELTAGINHTSRHEGYLPVLQTLANRQCHVVMGACEQVTVEQPHIAACDPESLIMHVRSCASVLRINVDLETSFPRFEETAFNKIEEHLFDRDAANSMELAKVQSFTFNRMGDLMFAPFNWHRFKAFIRRLVQRRESCPPERVQPRRPA